MALRIRLFGSLETESDGCLLRLPARKTEALLAVLALRPGVLYHREWLSALLWPDVPEAQARTSLRQAIGHLRKAFSEALVVSSGDQVHLDPAAAWVDSAEVERLLAAAPAERAPATELVRGGLLDGFPALEDPFGDWLSEERARFGSRIETRLEECVAALSAAGEIAGAIAVGARLVEIEPTRETAHRALMRLYSERGETNLALRQYERCRDVLERKLGSRPSHETEALRERLSSGSFEPRRAVASGISQGSERVEVDGRLRLAVLPFEAGKDSDVGRLLADGLTEDVTTELSRFRQLAVVARAGVARLAPDTPVAEVAQATGARLVLSGSVRIAGRLARVTAALVDATTALQLWAERWEVPHEDLFAVLDRLSRSVVGALALRIDEARLDHARRRPRERLEVYECWLRGIETLRRGTPESDEEARGWFEQALALSPSFARAYAGISLSHFNDWSCQAWERWDERERLAFENARRAVEIDDADPATHYILGRIYLYRREFELGERHVERALALNPNDVDVLVQAAVGLTQLGELTRARELADSALRLNPKHPDWYYLAAALPRFFERNLEEAARLLLCAPDCLVDSRAYLAATRAHQGDVPAARRHAAEFLAHFRQKITNGREPEAGEAARWVLQVNPLRRSVDTAYLQAGLSIAGL